MSRNPYKDHPAASHERGIQKQELINTPGVFKQLDKISLFYLHLHFTRLPENELYALLADHPAAFHQPRHDELHSHAHNGVQRLYDNPSKKDNLSYSVQILPAFKPDLDLIPTLDLPVGRD